MTPKVVYDTDTEMTLVRGDLGIEQGRYRVRNVRRGWTWKKANICTSGAA